MHISDFDYELPDELIAQAPLEQRDASRMMIVDRASRTWNQSYFASFPELVHAGDAVVINNTRVFPARLIGQRDPTGGRVELLLLREVGNSVWEALARPAHRLNEGAGIRFAKSELQATVVGCAPSGIRMLEFAGGKDINVLIDEVGQTPLPPYIKREHGTSPADRERYQTVFAQERGAVAAPTAGLHFTPDMLRRLREGGAHIIEITLHVGYGTFEPVRVDDIENHRVASEVFSISEEAASGLT